MKKGIIAFISLLAVSAGLASCSSKATEVIKTNSIVLSENTKSMYVSETSSLGVTILPENATDKSVTWSSSNNEVLEVNNEGLLTAKKEGQCKVNVKTNDSGLTATCDVTVSSYVACTKFSLSNSQYTVDLDGEEQLKIKFTPADCSYQYLTYQIEDPSIISIDQNGKVFGLKEGQTRVFATHKDNNAKSELLIKVKKTFKTDLYIGNMPVKYEGSQYENKYGNYRYSYDNNTLYLDKSGITDIGLELKEYADIRIGDREQFDSVKFLLSYEGTRDLHIELSGDINISLLNDAGLIGYLYVKNEVNVFVNGPSLIMSHTLTHSLIYGEKANVYFSNINTDIDCPSLCFGLFVDTAKFSTSKINLTTDKNDDTYTRYAGLYVGNGISVGNSLIEIHGFNYGAYCGTSYLYDSKLNVTATFVGVNFYALTTYDSDIIVISEGSGSLFFDGLYMHNGSISSFAESGVAISSTEATLLFEFATVNAVINNGNGMQAWRILAYCSELKVKSNTGYCMQCTFNAHVPVEEKATILVSYCNVNAETLGSDKCAIYGIGKFILEDGIFANDEKYLFEEIIIGYQEEEISDNVFAICDKDQTKLNYIVEGSQYIPTNGTKTVGITRTI